MKTKMTTLVLSTLLIIGGLLAGCGTDTTTEPDEEKKVENTTEVEDNQASGTEQAKENEENPDHEVAVEETVTAMQVLTYKSMMDELGKAKEGNPVAWDDVLSTYQKELQSAVNEVNGDYDTAITAAIEAGKSEQLDANVARQLVDKTTQSYFYQKQKRLHKDVIKALEAGNQEEAELAFAELQILAEEILIPTASKRDSYYGTDMQTQIENGLNIQEKAVHDGNIDDYAVYAQLTDKSVYRSYYLAANSYAEKIEKAVAEGETDKVKLQIMQAEGWGFFQAIKGSLSGGDEEAANTLDQLFSLSETDPTTITSEKVSALFTKAFIGKIKGYHVKGPKALEEGKVTEARVKALEGNVFMKAIELVMIDSVGSEKTQETFDHAEKWFEAIGSENKEEAAEHSAPVVEVLNEL